MYRAGGKKGKGRRCRHHRARLTTAVVNCGNLERPVALARASAVFILFLSHHHGTAPPQPLTSPGLRFARPPFSNRVYKCSLFGRSRFLEMWGWQCRLPVATSWSEGPAAPLGFYKTGGGGNIRRHRRRRRSASGGQHAGLPRYFFSFSPPFPPQF